MNSLRFNTREFIRYLWRYKWYIAGYGVFLTAFYMVVKVVLHILGIGQCV